MKSMLVLAAIAVTACGQTSTTSDETRFMAPAEALDVAVSPAADATCARGNVDAERSFILCEDGALRDSKIAAALQGATESDMSIEEVAKRYDQASQNLTGIEAATYGNLVRKDRRPVKGHSKGDVGTLTIDGKVFDIYQIQGANKAGTIFVERAPKR